MVEAASHFRDWFFAEVRAHTVLREEQARAAEITLVPDLDMAGARGSALPPATGSSVRVKSCLGQALFIRRPADDDDHGEAMRLIALVAVPMRAAGREAGTLAGA